MKFKAGERVCWINVIDNGQEVIHYGEILTYTDKVIMAGLRRDVTKSNRYGIKVAKDYLKPPGPEVYLTAHITHSVLYMPEARLHATEEEARKDIEEWAAYKKETQ